MDIVDCGEYSQQSENQAPSFSDKYLSNMHMSRAYPTCQPLYIVAQPLAILLVQELWLLYIPANVMYLILKIRKGVFL